MLEDMDDAHAELDEATALLSDHGSSSVSDMDVESDWEKLLKEVNDEDLAIQVVEEKIEFPDAPQTMPVVQQRSISMPTLQMI